MSDLREYEATYILKPNIDPTEKAALAERLKNVIEGQFGGEWKRMDDWGRRELAYAIEKQTYGLYVYNRFLAPPQAITELERILRLLDPVLKFLTVKVEVGMDTAARPINMDNEDDDEDDDDDDD